MTMRWGWWMNSSWRDVWRYRDSGQAHHNRPVIIMLFVVMQIAITGPRTMMSTSSFFSCCQHCHCPLWMTRHHFHMHLAIHSVAISLQKNPNKQTYLTRKAKAITSHLCLASKHLKTNSVWWCASPRSASSTSSRNRKYIEIHSIAKQLCVFSINISTVINEKRKKIKK